MRTYVVVVEYGNKGWTVGPFSNAKQADEAMQELPDRLNMWAEPVISLAEMRVELTRMDSDEDQYISPADDQ
jgi:hypothetical protein